MHGGDGTGEERAFDRVGAAGLLLEAMEVGKELLIDEVGQVWAD
jgi:hypothetical protein